MSSHLQDFSLLDVLPASISGDATMQAVAGALDPVLRQTVLSIPNLLLYARLGGQTAEMLSPLSRTVSAAGGLKPLPLPVLEQLAWQFHVDFREVATTDEQLAAMVRQSIPWHRIKGTPASIRAALALFGIDAIIEEDGTGANWATYQIGVDTLLALSDVRKIVAIAQEMAPARCRLFRIYNTHYDWRPAIWSEGPAWSEGFWSFYSGVRHPDVDGGADGSGLVVSFGDIHGAQSNGYSDGNVGCGIEWRTGVLIPYVDRPIWSRSDWGATYPLNSGFTVGELLSVHWCEKIVSSALWTGAWDARPWVESVLWDRILPAWSMARQGWGRAQAVQSWPGTALPQGRDGAYGDINACYSLPVFVISGQPPRWGAFSYSEEDRQRQEIPILEQFHEVFRATTVAAHAEDVLPIASATDVVRAAPVGNADHAVWGRGRWGESFAPYRVQHFFAQETLSAQAGERILAAQTWGGQWNARCWAETAGWGHILPEWSLHVTDWPLSQAVYSGGTEDSSACYGVPTATVTGEPPQWSGDVYSSDAPERTELVITARVTSTLALAVAPLEPSQPQIAINNIEEQHA